METSASVAIGVDVGGTKLAAGLVAVDGTVRARERDVTPANDADALVERVAVLVGTLRERNGLGAVPVGIGAAGLIDLAGVVRYAPNIAFRDFPLLARLRAVIDGPLTLDNDANVAAWGEYRFGAGANATGNMLMFTIGTGVGGGLVVGDRLVRGAQGMGGEFGHMVLDEGGPFCNCGNRGDLEALASGTAIGRDAREAADAGRIPPASPLYGRDDLTGKTVTQAAQAGDAIAAGFVAQAGYWLGLGIAALVNALDPELVVIGGGAMSAGDLLLQPAAESAYRHIEGAEHRRLPRIVEARLGDDAGIVGAALLALEAAVVPPAGAAE